MPFEKVETQVDFPAQERATLRFWDQHAVFDKLRAKNRGKPRWSFLDGPITANNPMGVHHAWGRTYKDAYQRYFAMTGHEQRYQNGFDCQGLWVEVEVEKELKLRSKRDIEDLVPGDRDASIDKFVQECKDRVNKFARIQTEQSIRLGYWMDWDRTDADWAKPPDERKSYFTMSEENNYTIWGFLKKCHQRGLVYRGYDSMPWCPRCGVGLSQMEMHEGYQRVAHRAVYVYFPLRGRDGEGLLIWTTTPWTLSSNVAAAVNPGLTYLKVRHKDRLYYVAKGAFTAKRLEEEFKRKEWVEGVPKLKTLEQMFKEKGGYEVEGEVPGSALVGLTYDGPFDELPAQGHAGGYPSEVASVALTQGWTEPKSARDMHRVIAWDLVGETEGTGIVHIAPGCGKEDFQLGKVEKLPPVAPLDEGGVFLPGFGALEGRSAVEQATTDAILDNLQGKGVFFAVEKYPHSYPHCWRCKTELLFRLVDEWFINMSWRDEIMRATEEATFLPESINGKARELDWLRNMGDWMISKKRFWGLALPIWVDDVTGEFEVIGSRAELKERAVEGWEQLEGHTPHRPWVDKVKIRNPKTGNLMSRIPDVGNPWLDAGIVPYSTLGYNHDRAYWEKWFPADFITESFPGQFRNWFYAILAMSTMMEGRAPFQVLLGHALVRDEKGEEMHKAKGNSIEFNSAADKMGADVMRWMYCRHNPSLNLNFGYGPAKELLSKFILKLWNTYAFFCNYARLDGFDPAKPQVAVAERPDLDRWILSDLQLLIHKVRQSFEEFNVMAFCLEAEKFVDDKLSNWYVRRNRRRFWKSEQGSDKLAAYQTLYTVLTTFTKLLAPVVPFLTETMYQNLRTAADPESVHLCDYPAVDKSLIDVDLSEDVEALLRLVALGSAARNVAKIKVRQPLAELKVKPGSDADRDAIRRFSDQLAEELNVRRITISEGPPWFFRGEYYLVRERVKFDFGSKAGLVIAALDRLSKERLSQIADQMETLTLTLDSGEQVSLIPGEFFELVTVGAEGWAAVSDSDTYVGVDIRITDSLKLEGMAREIVRHVQETRKKANLDMEDRIELYLATESEPLKQAIQSHLSYIAGETLVLKWAEQPLNGEAYQANVSVDGQTMRIALEKSFSDASQKREERFCEASLNPSMRSSMIPGFRNDRIRTALALSAIAVAALLLRWPLASVPLERDEGEYAYIARHWLQGDVPYRDAFDQKPPGVFAAYALFFQCFGRSIEAIHWGAQLYTLGTLALIYLAGRRLFGSGAGLAASLLAAFMTADCCVLGNAANTETFMILPLTAGFLATLQAVERASPGWAAVAGACGTAAMMCKQVALPNVSFHFLLLCVAVRRTPVLLAASIAGSVVAVAPVVVYFAGVGALAEFWDCVVGHNLSYARRVPWYYYPEMFFGTFGAVFRQWWLILVFTVVGLRAADEPNDNAVRPWLRPGRLAGLWLLASFAGVSIGGYFRDHYYIQAIPPVAVLAGRGLTLAARRWAPRRPDVAATALAITAVAYGVLVAPWYYLIGTPDQKCRQIYGGNPFPESRVVADYIATHSDPSDTVFVFGSEPQLLFYADRRSASRYIFVYPLMTSFPDTRDRQEQVVHELAGSNPRFIVTVNVSASFLDDENTPTLLRDELAKLLARDYRLVGTVGPADRTVRPFTGTLGAGPVLPPLVEHTLAVWERRTPAFPAR